MILNEIINSDCLEEMKKLPDKCINLIVTDPPYGIKYQSNSRVKSKRFDILKNDDNDMRFSSYIEMHRVLKENACCIVFASWKNYANDYKELEKMFTIRNTIIWHKSGGARRFKA